MSLVQAGDKLHDLVYSIAGNEHKDILTLFFNWKKIVGNILSDRASIHKLEHNVLFIAVSNNVWMQELILRKSKIIADIDLILKIKLDDIVIFLKDAQFRYKKPKPKRR
ncbi:MAG TPA: DUF721 domain-containing protein, partial [Candidatus Cloacimonetes bacterium]|nr:DUF721 domain-containing protein [Candidatus Cloacimonadota bacterium]